MFYKLRQSVRQTDSISVVWRHPKHDGLTGNYPFRRALTFLVTAMMGALSFTTHPAYGFACGREGWARQISSP
jgi:hypothetical protein